MSTTKVRIHISPGQSNSTRVETKMTQTHLFQKVRWSDVFHLSPPLCPAGKERFVRPDAEIMIFRCTSKSVGRSWWWNYPPHFTGFGGFKSSFFSPYLGKWQKFDDFFFTWVETTTYSRFLYTPPIKGWINDGFTHLFLWRLRGTSRQR